MLPLAVLARHYDPASPLYHNLVIHSVLVARKAREIAEAHLSRHPRAAIDVGFLTEAALLHDIGIRHCDAPKVLCDGPEPYIRHGVIGRVLLEEEGLPRHGLLCERHTGAGISASEVLELGLPLPPGDYLPVSLEEKIVCVADKFFGKTPGRLWREKTLEEIERSLGKHGERVLERWRALRREVLEP